MSDSEKSTTTSRFANLSGIWVVLIGVRIVAAVGLLAYPRLSDSSLTGWDSERFHEIATSEARPWAEIPVEYPPGSLILVKLVAGDDPVSTNDRIVVLSLLVDLGLAGLLRRVWGSKTGLMYLAIGLPLVPAGLLRFDLWAALAAIGALAALRRQRDGFFGALVVAGALIKVWPAVLIGSALAARRYRAAAVAVGLGAIAGVAWLGYGGLDAPSQVLSLRGATGWHIESFGGSISALFGSSNVVLENNAYRIGTMNPYWVLGGQLMALTALAIAVWRRLEPATLALVATAAMIVTAPLVSPQFLLWVTPFAAIAWPTRAAKAAAAAVLVTGLVGPIFGYANLADTLPSVILMARDALLVMTVVTGLTSEPATEPRQFRPRETSRADADHPGALGSEPHYPS